MLLLLCLLLWLLLWQGGGGGVEEEAGGHLVARDLQRPKQLDLHQSRTSSQGQKDINAYCSHPAGHKTMIMRGVIGMVRYMYIWLGLARIIYIRCIYGIYGRELTKYTVIYNEFIYGSGQPRPWPTETHTYGPTGSGANTQ